MADSKGGAGGMGMNMVTTVMAFSVSAFFVLFVFTRLLCARLHLSRAAAAADRAAGDAFVVQGYNVRRSPDRRVIHPSVLFDSDRAPGVLDEGEWESESFLCGRAGGARHPRPGAVRGEDLPHRQARRRRRRPATAAGAGGVAVKISKPFSLAVSLLLIMLPEMTNRRCTMDQVKLHFATIKLASSSLC